MRWVFDNRLRILLAFWSAALGLALADATGAGASTRDATSFSAHGSVEQVYATGLPAGAQTSLLDSSGGVISSRV